MTIDALPSVALLGIFDFYLSTYDVSWHKLVHVCRKWRNVVFKSPRRLNLELSCSFARPARAALDTWPPLPMNISVLRYQKRTRIGDADNVVAALEHNDRVHIIDLWDVSRSDLETFLAAMQEPFMTLTSLQLRCQEYEIGKVARGPNSFLGGSAPHLKTLT